MQIERLDPDRIEEALDFGVPTARGVDDDLAGLRVGGDGHLGVLGERLFQTRHRHGDRHRGAGIDGDIGGLLGVGAGRDRGAVLTEDGHPQRLAAGGENGVLRRLAQRAHDTVLVRVVVRLGRFIFFGELGGAVIDRRGGQAVVDPAVVELEIGIHTGDELTGRGDGLRRTGDGEGLLRFIDAVLRGLT